MAARKGTVPAGAVAPPAPAGGAAPEPAGVVPPLDPPAGTPDTLVGEAVDAAVGRPSVRIMGMSLP